MKKLILGIDTSNYTTSVALLTLYGELIASLKSPLPVKAGECGLRQSDAVFAHIKNIPHLMQRVNEYLNDAKIICVGVSERPRNVEGSYMPCFLSGVSVAEGIANTLNVPLYRFSHQCGHIMAALYSSDRPELKKDTFLAFHISGGTTEMLRVSPKEYGFNAELIGGTADLNAGQVIDRVGVYLGLSFPCGAELERLALSFEGKLQGKKPVIRDMKINLSGLENMAKDLYIKTNDKALVSAFVLDYIYRGISLLADAYIEKFGDTEIVFAGGVMSNSIIKEKLSKKYKANFAIPALSADNAVGIAVLAKERYLTENK